MEITHRIYTWMLISFLLLMILGIGGGLWNQDLDGIMGAITGLSGVFFGMAFVSTLPDTPVAGGEK